MNASESPLDGIRVLDFSQTLAGPYCTWLLSCLGADVVKVEPPTGDYLRAVKLGTTFAATNRNKRSIVLDLRSEEGRRCAVALASRFDVMLESFKPGTMQRFGLSYDEVRAVNPAIIYASISGYGQTGPYAPKPGYDPLAQALSGIMAATGEPDRGPVRIGASAIDYGTGVYTALSITAALHRRARTGAGARIDACLLETAISYMSQACTYYSATGELPLRRGSANDSFVPFQMFEASDGEVFVGVGTDEMFKRFCVEFDLPSLGSDPRFTTIQGRCDHREEVIGPVGRALAKLSGDEIIARLEKVGIPGAKILDVSEMMSNVHVQAREIFTEISDSSDKGLAVLTFPVRMDGVPREAGRTAPAIGEHTREVLSENQVETEPVGRGRAQ